MATKKATAAKRTTAKKPAAKKPRTARKADPEIVVEENVLNYSVEAVAADTETAAEIADEPVAKETLREELLELKPGALIAEFLGTFVLAGAVMYFATQGVTGLLGIGLVLTALVVAFGVASGAHLNPAITIAQYVNRKISGVKAASYIVVQVLGAVLALGLLTGLANAQFDYTSAVQSALEKADSSITEETISEKGGLAKYLSTTYQGMTVDQAASQLGVSKTAPKTYATVAKLTAGKEWTTFFYELIGAVVFGLGVGYAVFAKNKNAIETGLAVGIGCLAGLAIGGSAVVLNPAVASALQAFQFNHIFGADALNLFWWPLFIYVGATTIGMTAGVTAYRFALKDALSK